LGAKDLLAFEICESATTTPNHLATLRDTDGNTGFVFTHRAGE
jgi:hypothetical protein